MLGRTDSKLNRATWIVIHGGVLAFGLLLFMLAEDYGERSQPSPAELEQSVESDQESAGLVPFSKRTKIEKQIARLRDPIYGVRAKATRQLLAMGSPAVRPLAEALGNPDPDIRRHARVILAGLIRSDEKCFAELETVVCLSDHPASKAAAEILQRECDRRVDIESALFERRKANALRLLRDAREALARGQFRTARELVCEAEALEIFYQPTDDQPALVLSAIERAEQRTARLLRPTLITAERP